jgi:hypothetical protein
MSPRLRIEKEDSDLDWVLKVDRKTLPDLETLYFDFSFTRSLGGLDNIPPSDIPSARDCAERMKCLSLKRLALMNINLGFGGIVVENDRENFGKLCKGGLELGAEIVTEVDNSKEW